MGLWRLMAVSFDSDVAIQRTLRDLQSCADVVQADGLVFEELVGKYDPPVIGHYRWSAAFSASGAGGSQSSIGPLLNETVLKLCQRRKDKKDQFA